MRYLPILLCLTIAACTSDPAATTNGEQPAAGTQNSTSAGIDERDRTQKPEEVIALMGGDLTGTTVADLFAGDGYFTFKLIKAGANVIAVVNDAANAAKIEERKKQLGLGDDRLQVRSVPVGDPGLRKEEVDMAVIYHSFVGITNKPDFFARMRDGMRHPRPLIMVEWQYLESADGPPMSERIPTETIMDMIGEYGYSDVGAHSAKIPGQVIFMINDYIDMGGGPEGTVVPTP